MTEREQLLAAIEALDSGRTLEAAQITYRVAASLTNRALGGSGSVSIPSDLVRLWDAAWKDSGCGK